MLRLAELDVRPYEVFTACTPVFWGRRRSVLLGFFENLRAFNIAGFLISHSEHVCNVTRQEHGITCVLSDAFEADGDRMLMKERWHVLSHFLERNQPIAYVGADFRFVRGMRGIYEASTAAAVDATFDSRSVNHFTPDLVLVFPSPGFVSCPSDDACPRVGHTSSNQPR